MIFLVVSLTLLKHVILPGYFLSHQDILQNQSVLKDVNIAIVDVMPDKATKR